MATFAARRLTDIAKNVSDIIAIEWLEAAQGLDFRRPLKARQRLKPPLTACETKILRPGSLFCPGH